MGKFAISGTLRVLGWLAAAVMALASTAFIATTVVSR
jgi:hypothetical protein